MSKLIAVDIVSADHTVFKGEGEMVVASASTGELGILPGHVPLLAALKAGHISVKNKDSEELIYVSGGFIEVQPHKVTILADVAERADELDEERAKQAQTKALSAIKSETGIDFKRAQIALAEASARLEIIQKQKNLSNKEKRFAERKH